MFSPQVPVSLTLVWAEAPLCVLVVILCGCAPQFTIAPAIAGARMVRLLHESEREVTWLPLCVSTNHSCVCGGQGLQ